MVSQPSAPKRRVFVGMSGGVDSSVSAALLKERGFDVTGVFIKVWQPDWMECSWREDRLDAMRVCAHLGIPFVTLDLEKEYKKEVVDHMIFEYRAGRTPNPDIMCNRHVKFGGFFDWAMRQRAAGEDVWVATGHYVQVRLAEGEENRYELVAGKDQGKDQSYFLWTLTRRELSKALFPVGGMEKSETRRLARRFGLPVAEKRDSQGLCFIGKVDIKEFLSHYIAPKRGNVIDEKECVIGSHDGAMFLTLGERHGFSVVTTTPNDEPYYVIARDLAKNIVTVSHRSPSGALPIEKGEFALGSINWISVRPEAGKKYAARIRHLGERMPCRVQGSKIIFEAPLIVASGQSIVVYENDVCLGGGIVL
ncbi:MAG TPA: tRNA 2-thiouridine(34) synthase MnmA [Candidatus Paceibacterota bacterium]|nr:tRNA 2-thiouridine(34) synthase MnmA [Candidatus Paceibacterota bacterium]